MDDVERSLPSDVVQRASVRGREYAWAFDHVPEVIAAARSSALATVGGQVQYRFPDAICELYWLDADSEPRRRDERWVDYVARSADEVLTSFKQLVAETDFDKEASEFAYLADRIAEGVDVGSHLCFVLYFERESG